MKTDFRILAITATLSLSILACHKEKPASADSQFPSTSEDFQSAPSNDCDIEAGDYRTQSLGGYKQGCKGPVGKYVCDNWNCIGSLSIGCSGGSSRTFSTSSDLIAFMKGNSTGTFSDKKGGILTFANQILTLQLSVAIDKCDANYGASEHPLDCLILVDSDSSLDLAGKSVAEILEIANDVLGGCRTDYSKSEMNALLDRLNQNFHPDSNGPVDQGMLTCGACYTEDCGDFRTQTQDGWGASPNGSNSGQYLADHWADIDGLNTANTITIGCGSSTKTFSSASEVESYLPTSGNCSTPWSSEFAGQVLALAINIAMDDYVETFASSSNNLRCMKITGGTYDGKTVAEILQLANNALGGGCSTGPSACDLIAILKAINENYDNGTVDNGLLKCAFCDNP